MAHRRPDLSHSMHRRRRDALKALGLPCHLCGQPIDYSLVSPHPLSFTADHVEAVANGGDPFGELRPAHRRCNSSRGNGTGAHILRTSREW